MPDYVTGFQTADGVKKYDYNSLANLPESVSDTTNTVISPNADYAEVGEWADGNPDRENRLGYFVAVAEVGDNTIKIRKATSTDDVRGVSVYNPAFSGNASKDKYGEDGNLLPRYNYIGIMGIVEVIDNGRCSVDGRCMPADDGTAIPSTNNMGYAVLERVDARHVLIAVEPGADMIQRVKSDIEDIEKQLGEGGLDENELQRAIDTALAQAKASGEFDGADGKDGTSVTITNITESTESGGSNVVTFSDGAILRVKNGKDGEDEYGCKELLDDMTIEGFEREGVFVDVTDRATKHEGAFATGNIYSNIGETVSALYNYLELPVTAGKKYRIYASYSKYYSAVIFTDENGKIIYKHPHESNDTTVQEFYEELEIPSGVSKIFVNEINRPDANLVIPAKIEKFEKTSQLHFTAEEGKTLNDLTIEGYERDAEFVDVTAKAEKHDAYFAYCPSGSTLVTVASSGYNYHILPVAAGETYYIESVFTKYIDAYFLVRGTDAVVEKGPRSEVISLYKGEVTIPEGVGYLVVNDYVMYAPNNMFLAHIEKKETSKLRFVRTDGGAYGSSLYGKKLACVGDSITEATNPEGGYFKNYAELVAERNGMTIYKDGKGGSTMTDVRGITTPAVPSAADKSFCISRYLDVPADFDILTIWFGWNDGYYAQNQIGTIDSTEDTTFYGAYKKVLEYFITTYPTKKIGLIVPYGNSLVEPCRVAVRELSQMYGVPCLDLADGERCSLLWGEANAAQLARRAALTYDTTHPNQEGHEYLSSMYEEFIKRL
jgi:hypothetical protein